MVNRRQLMPQEDTLWPGSPRVGSRNGLRERVRVVSGSRNSVWTE